MRFGVELASEPIGKCTVWYWHSLWCWACYFATHASIAPMYFDCHAIAIAITIAAAANQVLVVGSGGGVVNGMAQVARNLAIGRASPNETAAF
jgi:hypothetical protein